MGCPREMAAALAEDACRIRKDHAPQTMSLLRQIALNRLGQDKSTKVGIKAKRKKAGGMMLISAKSLLNDFYAFALGNLRLGESN
ncbi:MAG: hypothetical protein IGR76_03580 [Synechococcales cyanobacterium T60_A2020_003]|nr:hypothetical protein [Synechococcales cyanobacterium T60_A2020_003]